MPPTRSKKHRFPNAWILYSNDFCKTISAGQKVSRRIMIKQAGINWHSMNLEEKNKWFVQADRNRIVYWANSNKLDINLNINNSPFIIDDLSPTSDMNRIKGELKENNTEEELIKEPEENQEMDDDVFLNNHSEIDIDDENAFANMFNECINPDMYYE